MNFLQSRSAYY